MNFYVLASLFSLLTLVAATPSPLSIKSNIEVRDPAIWYNPDSKKYFVFSTNEGIKIFTSPSLTGPWTRSGSVLPKCSKIDLPGNCNLWAPDINFQNGKYVLYYSVSDIGSQDSAIGVATSPSMEAGTWTDLGSVLTSKKDDVYNAIDPNIINDNGLKLSFGSYWNGTYTVDLEDVNKVKTALPGTHLAGGAGRPAEGGFTYKPANSEYWFYFFSDGTTPLIGAKERPEAGKEYKVLHGRSKSSTGPFKGVLGNEMYKVMTPPPGTLVLGSHDNVYAPGGQSIFHDPVSNRDVMIYHYVPNDAPIGAPSYLGINYLDFSSGWAVVVE